MNYFIRFVSLFENAKRKSEEEDETAWSNYKSRLGGKLKDSS